MTHGISFSSGLGARTAGSKGFEKIGFGDHAGIGLPGCCHRGVGHASGGKFEIGPDIAIAIDIASDDAAGISGRAGWRGRALRGTAGIRCCSGARHPRRAGPSGKEWRSWTNKHPRALAGITLVREIEGIERLHQEVRRRSRWSGSSSSRSGCGSMYSGRRLP